MELGNGKVNARGCILLYLIDGNTLVEFKMKEAPCCVFVLQFVPSWTSGPANIIGRIIDSGANLATTSNNPSQMSPVQCSA